MSLRMIATSEGFERFSRPCSSNDGYPLHGSLIADIAAMQCSVAWHELFGKNNGVWPLATFALADAWSHLNGDYCLVVFDSFAVCVKADFTIFYASLLDFTAKADNACLESFLVLFPEGFVDVRDTMNGEIRQVISARVIKCLNFDIENCQYGEIWKAVYLRSPKLKDSVKVAMQYPENDKFQLARQLVLNDWLHWLWANQPLSVLITRSSPSDP